MSFITLMIFDEPSRQPLPTSPDLEEVRYVALKGLSSLVPGGGELFGLLTSPLARRRDMWLEDLERRLRDLEGRIEGFRFENLTENEEFVSATAQASQSALKTHQVEKLEALKNAVLNVAAGGEPDVNRQAVFLDLIDRFTPLHLALLRFFQCPNDYIAAKGIKVAPERDRQPVYLLLLDCIPGLQAQVASPVEGRDGAISQFLDIVVTELADTALVSPDLKNAYQTPPPYPRWTTHLGDDFLDFINPPINGAQA